MAISAHHYKVPRDICRVRTELHLGRADRSNDDFLELDIEAVTGEMMCDVSAGNFVALMSVPMVTTSITFARERNGCESAMARAALRLRPNRLAHD